MQFQTAVVYLVRAAEGPEPVRKFADSYQKFFAGKRHDLITVWKGFDYNGNGTEQQKIIAPLGSHKIYMPDDGVDITAYQLASRRIPHRRAVFLNTFSEIVSTNWLAKMCDAADQPGVGLVGATGSYQSLYDSLKLISKAVWLSDQGRMPYDRQFALEWNDCLKNHAGPDWFANRTWLKDLIERFRVLYRGRLGYDSSLDDQFERFWREKTVVGGSLHFVTKFRPYPNVHVRSNGFMIDPKLMLQFFPETILAKIDAFQFESGDFSLTNMTISHGLKCVLAGADGRSFDIPDWPNSGTFRCGKQKNLLISDNQTRAFPEMNYREKQMHVRMTWGPPIDINAMAPKLKNPVAKAH